MNEADLAETVSVESLVSQVTDEFMDRLDRGEQPTIEEFAGRHPEIAVVLRQVLPALQALRSPPADMGLPASQPPTVGCLGDYRIRREVGRGGMGVVYEAEQISLGRRVALKVLPFAAALDGKQLQRFKNEAQAAAHLHHQNIVPVYGVGCERGVHYYAMQFIDGQTVAALIHELRQSAGLQPAGPAAAPSLASSLARELVSGRWASARRPAGPAEDPTGPFLPAADALAAPTVPTPLPPTAAISSGQSTKKPAFFRTVAALGVQAAQALEHAHQLGVVHRDIKPANLLVDGRGNLWITDFGLAHCQSQVGLTMTGDLVGTLRYMSPEQALGQRVAIDHRTDLYSLGATLYELLTLEPVFCGKDRQELLRQIAVEEPRLPRRLNPAIPAELETIVIKATEKSPADRYSTAQELADDLERFLKDEPIRAKRPTLVQRSRRWARRHQPLVWSAVVATVVVLLLAVAMLVIGNLRIQQERNLAREYQKQALDRAQEAEHHARLARTNEEATDQQRQQAQENLKDALAAVDQMLTRVSQERLLDMPQMEHVRRELLEDALKFYQKFLEKKGDDPVIRRETAWAYRRLAGIQRYLGQLVEAEKSFRKAFAMFEELQAQSPFEPSTRVALLQAHLQFARLLCELENREEPEEHLRRAVQMAEDLVKEFPKDPGHAELLVGANINRITLTSLPPDQAEEMLRRNLRLTKNTYYIGYIYSHLGMLGVRQGRYPEAKKDYLESLEKFEAVASKNPSSSMAQRDVGGILVLLADAMAADGQREEAEPLYRRAVAILDKMANDYPGIHDYRNQQAEAHYKYATLLKTLDRTAAAEKAYRRAVDLWEKLATDFAAIPAYQQIAFDRRLGLGRFLVEAGRAQDAQQIYGEAMARSGKLTADFPTRLKHWQGLVRSHIELGRLLERSGKTPEAEAAIRQALAISERLEAEHGGKPDYRREVARSHFEAAGLLRLDSRYSEAEKLYRWALEHYVRLAEETPRARQAREELAWAHFSLADHYRWAPSRLADSEKLFRRALEECEKLSADFPTVPGFRILTADCSERLASVLLFQGRLQEAEQGLKEALALAERLAAEHPTDPGVRMTLAMGSRHLGQTMRDKAPPREVEKAYRRAEAILEKLIADFPRESWYRFEYGVTCQMLVTLLARDLKQPQEAEEFYRRTVAIFEKLAAEDSRAPSNRGWLANAHREWASCLEAIGRTREAKEIYHLAIANFSKAVELGSRDIWWVWYPLALLHLSTGRTKEYRVLCERLLERFGPANDPDRWVVIICKLAPDALADLTRPVQLAEKLLARDPHNADLVGILGDTLYRKGDLEAAVQRMEASIRAAPGIGVHWRRLFLAMAYHRLGRAAEARQLLQEEVEWIAKNGQEKLADGAELPVPLPWSVRLDLQLLRREAEELLKQK